MSGETSEIAWAVVNTHVHKVSLALRNLDRQGFMAYCPMMAKRIRHARKFSEVYRPLFPGYVFVALNPAKDQWRPILSTFGVRNSLGAASGRHSLSRPSSRPSRPVKWRA